MIFEYAPFDVCARIHRYEYEVGLLAHVPRSAVRREPTDTVPVIEGATVATGTPEGVAVTAVDESPPVEAPLRLVTARIRTW